MDSATPFAHASEAEMARILDFYQVRWEYEPHTFPILWNLDGAVVESFSPDFYLPDLDLYLEMTTLRQKLVRKKNRKLRRLRELYYEYVTTVSTAEMAISWELSAWLWTWLERNRPASVLDLGSGFSSALFRLWQETSGADAFVVSADTDPEWLAKTGAFVRNAGFPDTDLVAYPAIRGGPWDLVLFDLADRESRASRLDAVSQLVAEGGALLVDDIDYPPYRLAVDEWVRRSGWSSSPLPETTDRFLRAARLLQRPTDNPDQPCG